MKVAPKGLGQVGIESASQQMADIDHKSDRSSQQCAVVAPMKSHLRPRSSIKVNQCVDRIFEQKRWHRACRTRLQVRLL